MKDQIKILLQSAKSYAILGHLLSSSYYLKQAKINIWQARKLALQYKKINSEVTKTIQFSKVG
jgi:hypothetical protein